MTSPEDALAVARAQAAEARAAGGYPADDDGLRLEPEPLTIEKLLEWATVEPDLREVRSTRRLGAPMTALKRGLLRVLAQYHVQLLAQQARFNLQTINYVNKLEKRIEALERAREDEGAREDERAES
ncbi:MAG: hypothetical protein QOD66_2919 [Solirubrobacteraceae bacterium]|nr:hypothetical protein [Solirubrobacteraceae bacterium]